MTYSEFRSKLNEWLSYHPKDVNAFCARKYVDKQQPFVIVDKDTIIKTFSL